MSQAQSRRLSTSPYSLVAAAYGFALEVRTTASVDKSMRGPATAAQLATFKAWICTGAK